MKILVISNNISEVNLIKRELSSSHKITFSHSVSDGLNLLPTGSYDCILSELRLPILTGKDLLKLRSTFKYSTPTIIFSEKVTVKQFSECIDLGAIDCVNLNELSHSLDQFIANSIVA